MMYTTPEILCLLYQCKRREKGTKGAYYTSQKYCASDCPTSFTDALLNITSLVEFSSKPLQQDPTTRQTPSGLCPRLICQSLEAAISNTTKDK